MLVLKQNRETVKNRAFFKKKRSAAIPNEKDVFKSRNINKKKRLFPMGIEPIITPRKGIVLTVKLWEQKNG